jgi:hypothetical protein
MDSGSRKPVPIAIVMKNQKSKMKKYYLFIIIAACSIIACSKMEDTYADFIKDGEIVYTGRVDSLKIFPGRNRIKLSWQLISDQKITRCKVFWNDGADMMEIPVQRTSGVDTINILLTGMPERTYTFDVYTYDNDGHSSIKEDTIGVVYGDVYAGSLFNRPLKTVSFSADTARLEWAGASAQNVSVELKYTDALNVERTIVVPRADSKTNLPKFKKGSSFQYRSLYLPEKTAIDTFFTAYESRLVP